MTNDLELHTCPGCGGEMYAEDSDRYCIECHHDGRV